MEGADGGSQTVTTTQFLMPENDVHVQAHFRYICYDFSYSIHPTQGGSINGLPSSPVLLGTSVNLEAVANATYVFDHWVVVGADGGNQTITTTSFTMPANAVQVQAHFAVEGSGGNNSGGNNGGSGETPAGASISVYASPGGNIYGLPGGTINAGQYIYLTAGAQYGYVFDHWVIDGVTMSNLNQTFVQFTMPDNPVTVEAHFRSITHALTVDVAVEGTGNVYGMPGSTIVAGQYVYLTAVPNNGYSFDYWVVEGVDGGSTTVSYQQFTMPDNAVHVTAYFR